MAHEQQIDALCGLVIALVSGRYDRAPSLSTTLSRAALVRACREDVAVRTALSLPPREALEALPDLPSSRRVTALLALLEADGDLFG